MIFSFDWQKRFINLADHVSSWSKDPSTKVGAVIVNSQKQVIGIGYNGFPRGVDDKPSLYEDRSAKYKRVVHAEVNAILNASSSVHNCHMFLNKPPCNDCAKLIIQSSLSSVTYPQSSLSDTRFEFIEGHEMMTEAKIIINQI